MLDNPQIYHRLWLLICLLLSLLVLLTDYITGPYILFPIFFVLPVSIAAWTLGVWWGLGLALGLPLARLYYVRIWATPELEHYELLNAAIQAIVLSLLAWFTAREAVQSRMLKREVKALEGILPICSFCKKIRDDAGNWQPLEEYISLHSEAYFSHTFCPECGRKHYPDIFKETKPPA
ncbi:MAG: hypothetical protein FOGNACKC_05430 [Anaerolineae bacterium]|nr:hypothetical protein [Anaerolineae bacterium]